MKIRFNKDLVFKPLSTRQTTKRIVIHHTAGNVNAPVVAIHNQHRNKGWSGIGYHVYNRLNPTTKLWECWYGRPLHTVGSHVAGNNSDTIGIAFAGNYEATQPSDELLNHIREVLKYFANEYPTCVFTYHRICKGASTACPGKFLIPHLRQIAKELNLKIDTRF